MPEEIWMACLLAPADQAIAAQVTAAGKPARPWEEPIPALGEIS